jgi:hypothetical protein
VLDAGQNCLAVRKTMKRDNGMAEASVIRFKDLSIHGFRRIHDVSLPLRPLSVMIEANGTGKTSQGPPESVNHNRTPSVHIKQIFESGTCRDSYSKTRDAHRILRDKDLSRAAAQCPELKAFLNTILTLNGGQPM